MATINVKDAAGSTVALEKPLTPGATTASASRPVTLATDDVLVTAVGAASDAAVAAGAAGSLLAKLRAISRDLVANIVLAAGANLIGKVGIDQTTPGTTDSVSVKSQAFSAAVSLTRTADTNAYAANDILGAATGSTAALTFASIGPSGKEIMITSAALEIDASAIISGETSYRLYLYNGTPPSALGDNAAFDLPSGDRASFLGYVDLGAPVDLGSTLYVEANILNKQVLLSGTSLFGYLVTNGTYTPTSARVHKITLHSVAV